MAPTDASFPLKLSSYRYLFDCSANSASMRYEEADFSKLCRLMSTTVLSPIKAWKYLVSVISLMTPFKIIRSIVIEEHILDLNHLRCCHVVP